MARTAARFARGWPRIARTASLLKLSQVRHRFKRELSRGPSGIQLSRTLESEPSYSVPIVTVEHATAAPPVAAPSSRYDRSIVSGPLSRAVWKIAWPTMLTNIIGGAQGIIDHVMV